MGELQQVIQLLVAGILGGIGLWWSRRSLKRAGFGQVSVRIIGNLRDLAASWEAKYDFEREAHAVTRAELATERAARRMCESDLDDLRDRNREGRKA